MKTLDLIIEIIGKDTAVIRQAVGLFNKYAECSTINPKQADVLRRFARDYHKLVKKHGGEI